MIEYVVNTIFFFYVWLLWAMICNIWTFRERSKIIARIYESPNWRELSASFNEVHYYRHQIHRMLFTNPIKFYPENIQQVMRGGGVEKNQ